MQQVQTKLNPQADKIYVILLDYAWHCPIDWKYSDGHGKRLTDINRYLLPKGNKLAWEWCDCGRHIAQVKKRKIVPLDFKAPHLEPPVAPPPHLYHNQNPAEKPKDIHPLAKAFMEKWAVKQEPIKQTLF